MATDHASGPRLGLPGTPVALQYRLPSFRPRHAESDAAFGRPHALSTRFRRAHRHDCRCRSDRIDDARRRGRGHTPVPRSISRDVFDVEERSVAEWQAALATGELTSRQLVERYLQRIESLDAQGPTLRAVLETNPDAFDIATALDAERKAGKLRGPLHGIPVLVKDNVDTADRMHTTAGSEALAGERPMRDAFIVERLRAAGAIVLGKTNLSEWANFRSTHSSSGWSRAAGRRAIPMRSTARPRARAPARESPPRRTTAPWPSAPRPMAPSPHHRRRTRSSVSSPQWGW
jgi:hypothetical protein